MPHVEKSLAAFTTNGKRLRQQLIEGLSVIEALTKLGGFSLECGIIKGSHLIGQGIDTGHDLAHAL